MRSTSGLYVIGLDHVRAVAALLVFMWHFAHPPFGLTPHGYVPRFFVLSIFNEGHTGVALFMTLSGFIFSLLSYGKEIELSTFYRNRFFRVFPLLFFWCLFGVAVQGYNPTDVARNLFTLIDNKIPANGWTIIVEAQFYLLFPFVHHAVESRYRSTGLRGPLLYFATFIGFMWVLRWGTLMETGSAQEIAYWTIFGRIDQFFSGALFFYPYHNRISTLGSKRAFIVLVIAVLALLAYYRWFNTMGGLRGYEGYPSSACIWIVMPTIEGFLYGSIIVSYMVVSRNFSGFVARAVAYIGTISYSIYLSNAFVIPLLERLHSRTPFTKATGFGEYFAWGLVVGFPIICVFSAFTFRLIEQPFLERRRRYVR
jgi:peptidoglycan/LPS O-acetylase OafA/YrhL